MTNDFQGKIASPESAPSSLEMALREWRQIALAEGIAPTKIDAYLLGRPDVPEDVKKYVRGAMEKSSVAGPAGELSTEALPVQPSERPTPRKESATIEQPVDLSGEVGMLNASSEIEKIKKETMTPEDLESLDRKKEQPEVPSEQIPEKQIAQTAERKEATTTSGTQDTAGGVATRISLGMSGYQPSQQVAENASEIAEKGDVKDAKTWQAALLQRFMEIWGSFKGLFS